MIELKDIKGIYFIGIGGIGMSALALYFARGGYAVAGYDRMKTRLTETLSGAGCNISYNDDINTIPVLFKDLQNRNRILIVYTPAIPVENRIFSYFRDNKYSLQKRSEVLGDISLKTDTIAIAGTHGKTTVSTMTAHLLKQSHIDCSAFLGGISKNYDSNLLTGQGRYTVMEADEYDRSFHRLNPLIAVITAVDADHLEIYGDRESMIEAYNVFCKKIRNGGTLICNYNIRKYINPPAGVTFLTYGNDPLADFTFSGIEHKEDIYLFDLKTPDRMMRSIRFPFPGIINIENLTAAVAVALTCGATEDEIRSGISLFKGVRRRFDIRVNLPGIAYVDDYAHHPEEIRACILSLREYFIGRKITAIFQPHLFTRTRDHAEGFAEILDQLDEVILLPVYPAREKPIPGVSSGLIFNKMKLKKKRIINIEDIPGNLETDKLDVLVTIGAGDIDTVVELIEQKLREEAII